MINRNRNRNLKSYIINVSEFSVLCMYQGHITLFFYDINEIIRAAYPEAVLFAHIGHVVDDELIDWIDHHFSCDSQIERDLVEADIAESAKLLCL